MMTDKWRGCVKGHGGFLLLVLLRCSKQRVPFYWSVAVWFVCSRVPHVERISRRALPHGCLESTPPLTISGEEHGRFILVALGRITKDLK